MSAEAEGKGVGTTSDELSPPVKRIRNHRFYEGSVTKDLFWNRIQPLSSLVMTNTFTVAGFKVGIRFLRQRRSGSEGLPTDLDPNTT